MSKPSRGIESEIDDSKCDLAAREPKITALASRSLYDVSCDEDTPAESALAFVVATRCWSVKRVLPSYRKSVVEPHYHRGMLPLERH
eukprot:8462021-Pyramimonas_sp.AAC.1